MTELAAGFKFYLLAASVHVGLIWLAELPIVFGSLMRLAWWLSPYRSFPMPAPYGDWQVANGPPGEWFAEIGVLTSTAFFLALSIGLLHTAIFGATVLAHRWFGWPRYWRDVRPRINLTRAWIGSARRTWWIWPVFQAVWLLTDGLHWGFEFAGYPMIDTRPFYWCANLAVIVMAFSIRTSAIVRGEVLHALERQHRRCRRCGYPLRGIESARCPECGCLRDDSGTPEYRVRWGWLDHLVPRRRVTRSCVALVLILAPVWCPLLLVRLPRGWLARVPAAIRPSWQMLLWDANAFPLRFDAVCQIRHAGALAEMQLFKVAPWRARWEVAYWSDEAGYGRVAPDQTMSGSITNPMGPSVQIGPWRFRCNVALDALWLTRPDASFDVRAYVPDRLGDGGGNSK